MISFENATKLFNADKLTDLYESEGGIRYLKLKSISRKGQLIDLAQKNGIRLSATTAKEMFSELYSSSISEKAIGEYINSFYTAERAIRESGEQSLLNELYKIEAFDWGGLHQNSLEKTIVDNYVKKIKSYDTLDRAISEDLHRSLRSYVLASWYNHWTSIIIEDIFNDHKYVLPATGKVKKIDFFIRNRPFDLKVTYLPEGYIKEARKALNKTPELTLLKSQAKSSGISFEKNAPESFLMQDLWKKLGDHPDRNARNLLDELHGDRNQILDTCISTPLSLMTWLYENQGIRRFDASYRLFLVLVNKSSFFKSWELKRAKDLIKSHVHAYLDSVSNKPGKDITFAWEGRQFSTVAEVIFVVK